MRRSRGWGLGWVLELVEEVFVGRKVRGISLCHKRRYEGYIGKMGQLNEQEGKIKQRNHTRSIDMGSPISISLGTPLKSLHLALGEYRTLLENRRPLRQSVVPDSEADRP